MISEAITYGSRIKYAKEGNLLVSIKIYDNGMQMVRVVIDTETVTFKFVDPATGVTFKEGPKGINNLEVLQRHVKKELMSYLGIRFDKEVRQKRSE